MNDEILEYAKELKKRSESLIKAELENDEFNYRLRNWDKLRERITEVLQCNQLTTDELYHLCSHDYSRSQVGCVIMACWIPIFRV